MRVSALKSKVDEKDSYFSAQCESCVKAELAVHEVEIEQKRMLSRVLTSFERKKDRFFYKRF